MFRYEFTRWTGLAGPVLASMIFAFAIIRAYESQPWPAGRMFLGVALKIVFPRLVGEAPDIVFTTPPSSVGFGVFEFGRGFRQN